MYDAKIANLVKYWCISAYTESVSFWQVTRRSSMEADQQNKSMEEVNSNCKDLYSGLHSNWIWNLLNLVQIAEVRQDCFLFQYCKYELVHFLILFIK